MFETLTLVFETSEQYSAPASEGSSDRA